MSLSNDQKESDDYEDEDKYECDINYMTEEMEELNMEELPQQIRRQHQ